MRLWLGVVAVLIGALIAAPAAAAETVPVWGGKALLTEAPELGDKAGRFKGSVEWRTGVDAGGGLTLIGTARFPERSLGVDLVLGASADASLPASHLLELRFQAGRRFPAKAIDQLAGVMSKDEANGRGTPLSGVVAKVSEGVFLFALEPTDAALARNMTLIGERDFIDIAVVYDDGRRAIITLAVGRAKAAFAAFADAAFR